jgi:hypothetical protein
MDGLEQRLRQRREEILSSLPEDQRRVLEDGGALGPQDTQKMVRALTDGLWEALFEAAREIDRESED